MKKLKPGTILLSIVLWIFAILAVAGVFAFSIWNYTISPVTKKGEEPISRKIDVPSGSSVRQVSKELEEMGLIRSGTIFYYAARFNLFDRTRQFTLKSGTYTLTSAMNMKEIYSSLQSGAQEFITVRFPEGLTLTKIGRILEENQICGKDEFVRNCKSLELLSKYSIPAESFEGYLFPDTYFFTKGMTGTDVISIMADNFFNRISSIKKLSELSPEELHKKVILASVIEREYRIPDEAPVIASVFTNRLANNIGLYSCATIEYILTEIEGRPHPDRITYKDLKIDSPYNTYMWAGLPYGPISNPGLVALNAGANPAKTNYFYFVLTNPEKGSHTFSRNFDEHKAAENTNYLSK